MTDLTDAERNNIQIVRGAAIAAVVFIHNTPLGAAQVYCRPFLNFSTGTFLFLSGMHSNANKWDPRKRIIKVVVPYVLWSLIYVALYNFRTPEMIPALYIGKLFTGKAADQMYYIL